MLPVKVNIDISVKNDEGYWKWYKILLSDERNNCCIA